MIKENITFSNFKMVFVQTRQSHAVQKAKWIAFPSFYMHTCIQIGCSLGKWYRVQGERGENTISVWKSQQSGGRLRRGVGESGY